MLEPINPFSSQNLISNLENPTTWVIFQLSDENACLNARQSNNCTNCLKAAYVCQERLIITICTWTLSVLLSLQFLLIGPTWGMLDERGSLSQTRFTCKNVSKHYFSLVAEQLQRRCQNSPLNFTCIQVQSVPTFREWPKWLSLFFRLRK